MARKFPVNPTHPERLCWGCDRYCAANGMLCGNGSVRTPHPAELFGDDWQDWNPARPDPDPDADADADADADPTDGGETPSA